MTDHEKPSAADHDPRRQLLDDDPPPIRSGKKRPLTVIASAVILFVLILVVLLNIESEYEQRADVDDPLIPELITPRALDRDARGDDPLDIRRGFQPQLARGGWIQIADDDGRLSQQYRCEQLEPLPDGWLEMLQPEMEIYLQRNRILTLRGDTAVAHAPSNAIESGTMTGNVIVKLFEAPEGQQIDVQRDEPALQVETDEASFDNFLGEIRCDDWVSITTPQLELPGRQLSLLHDDQNNRFQLRIQQFDYIRLFDDAASARASASARQRAASPRAEILPASHQDVIGERRPSSRREARQSRPPSARDSSGATFYQLTLRDKVRIDQGEAANRRIAVGDRLDLIFSSETEELQEHGDTGYEPIRNAGAASRAKRPQPHGPLPRLTYETIAMLAIGTIARADDDVEHLMGPGITLVRSDGPLTIVPLDDGDSRRPTDPKDAYVDLIGSPVILCDLAGDSEAHGERFTYLTTNKQAELIGSSSHPLIMDSPELAAGGERFRFSDVEGTGGFIGPGWMVSRLREIGERGRVGCAAVPASALAFAGSRMPAPPIEPDDEPELQITWEEGMDLLFDEEGENRSGRIREAIFRGNVRVASEEFTMNAGEMTVGFPKDSAGDTRSIETIHARHDVRVLGAGSSSGDIQCQDLHLTLTRNVAGETVPTMMLATGNVQAMEDDHIIWADSLHVTFMQRTDAIPEDGYDDQDEEEPDRRDSRRNVDVETITAETDVQVLLADGTRAFADRLDGDGVREVLELTGDDVFIVSDTMIMDQGRRLILDRKAGTATSPGPGQLRLYERPVVVPEQRERILRPVVDAKTSPLELRVRWRERMVYDGQFNDGAGSVDFRGDVDAVAEPSPIERSTMTGQALTLEFVHAEPQARTEADVSQREATDARPTVERSGRELNLLIARNDAKLESHTWATPDRTGDPNIFYVAGQHIEYHPLVNEALVVGNGELLMHDVRRREDEAAVTKAPFGTRGSTMMTWSRQLHMTNTIDEIYQLRVEGDITMRHRDLDNKASWLTCDRLDATIVRDVDDEQNVDRRGLEFGGSSRMERMKASGGVNINTDHRDIACDEFDYDVRSGIGRASATRPGVVAMQTVGIGGVTTAQEIIWNMELDTIRIVRPAGAGPG